MKTNMKNKFRGKFKKKGNNLSNLKGKDIFTKGSNDIRWYAKNPVLTKIAGLVNFFNPIGSKFSLNRDFLQDEIPITLGSTQYNLAGVSKTVPGIMSLTWFPTPGVSISPNSPANVSMAQFFTWLRTKNFSTSVYDPCDVMFYFLAVDSLFAMYAYMVMIYSYAKKYLFTNRYTPKAILTALNVNPDDIINNLDNFLFYINIVKEKLSVLRVPKSIDIISRHMHMSANVYKDSETEKCQYYVFVPAFLYTYDATAPALNPVNIGFETMPLTFDDIKLKMDAMLDAILPDEDMNIIAADVQKYLDTDYWTVNSIDWDTVQEPIYDKEMLWQIHNADFLLYQSATGLSITQQVTSNNNTIVYFNPEFSTSAWQLGAKRVIDSENEVPSAEEIVESTRFKWTVGTKEINGLNFKFNLGSCGSEIICNAHILQFDDTGAVKKLLYVPYPEFISKLIDGTYYIVNAQSSPTGNKIYFDGDVSIITTLLSDTFKYAPMRYMSMISLVGGTYYYTVSSVIGSLDNYCIIEDTQLDALHEQALLSQFDVMG